VPVYNLTLESENVYYANGVLVQNCADAGFICLDVARMRHGLVSGAKAKEQPKATDGPTESPWAAFARKVKEAETFFGQSFTYGG
jgi:hypothetical protein